MRRFTNWFTTACVVVGVCAAGSADATNGYFTHGIGAKNKSMAGAGIAMPEDAIDVTNNPAVAPFVGDQLIVGAAIFSPIRKYQTTAPPPQYPPGTGGRITIGPNDIKSDSNYFIVPHISKSWQLKNDSAWALSFYGRGGMNTDWRGGTATFDENQDGIPKTEPGTYGAGDAGVDFSQAFLDITWAKKLNDRLSLGISGVLVAQIFEATGVGSFWALTETCNNSFKPPPANPPCDLPQNLSNNGHDWAFGGGLKIGLHSALSDQVSLGIAYQTRIYMSEFDDYADLFSEQGDMDIPPNLKIGLTFRANEDVALSFDIEHTWYSDIDAVGNSISRLFTGCPVTQQGGMDTSFCLGGDNGAGFGWEDMTTYKVGLAWKAGEDWTWRFGYSYGKQPIPESEMSFNILAPGVMESHLTAGFTLSRTPNRELNVALMYAPNKSVTGPQNFDPLQNVTFEMYEWELEVSYGWRF
jgi:long-chain fatty acid transport protein